MTHLEITKLFVTLGLKKGDFVEISLNDDSKVQGELSESTVSVEVDDKNDYIDSTSRIGLIPLPSKDGKITSKITYPYYSSGIVDIARIK